MSQTTTDIHDETIADEQLDTRYKGMSMPDSVKSVDKSTRSVLAMASTETMDRDGEIISAKAFEDSLAEFMANPVMLWTHDKQQPIGSWRDVRITSKGLEGRAVFGDTPRADEIWRLYRDGHLKGFSVGYNERAAVRRSVNVDGRVVKAKVITKGALREISACALPTNPEALAVRSLNLASNDQLAQQLESIINKCVLNVLPNHIKEVKDTVKALLSTELHHPLHRLIQRVIDLQGKGFDGDGECFYGHDPHGLDEDDTAHGKSAIFPSDFIELLEKAAR